MKLSIIRYIKDTLFALGVKPKASLGQNFLIEPNIYEKILEASEIKRGDKIVEVGPGLGTLTEYLLEAVGESGSIIAIEKDDVFVKILEDKFKNAKNVKIIHRDVLNFKFQISNFKTKSYKIVGNIPYYLTSKLLRTVFEEWSRPELIVLMVQKEVAERIVVIPPKSNLLSTSVQYFSNPKIVKRISRGNFWPKPKIDSAIIKLNVKRKIKNEKYQKDFFKIVKAGFSGKRKQLINSFCHALKMPKESVQKNLNTAGIDSKRRPETLTIPEWIKITKTFHSRF